MPKDSYDTVAERVRQNRLEAGLSLEALGERAGITGAYISHIEARRKKPTLETLERLAQALDLKVSELFADYSAGGRDEDKPYLRQFSRLIKGLSPAQKRRILDIVRDASALTKRRKSN